jgi:hypothetical protein
MFHSVSAEPSRRHDVIRMGEWIANELRDLGAESVLIIESLVTFKKI